MRGYSTHPRAGESHCHFVKEQAYEFPHRWRTQRHVSRSPVRGKWWTSRLRVVTADHGHQVARTDPRCRAAGVRRVRTVSGRRWV